MHHDCGRTENPKSLHSLELLKGKNLLLYAGWATLLKVGNQILDRLRYSRVSDFVLNKIAFLLAVE